MKFLHQSTCIKWYGRISAMLVFSFFRETDIVCKLLFYRSVFSLLSSLSLLYIHCFVMSYLLQKSLHDEITIERQAFCQNVCEFVTSYDLINSNRNKSGKRMRGNMKQLQDQENALQNGMYACRPVRDAAHISLFLLSHEIFIPCYQRTAPVAKVDKIVDSELTHLNRRVLKSSVG